MKLGGGANGFTIAADENRHGEGLPVAKSAKRILIGAVVSDTEHRGSRIERRERLRQLQSGGAFVDVDWWTQLQNLLSNCEPQSQPLGDACDVRRDGGDDRSVREAVVHTQRPSFVFDDDARRGVGDSIAPYQRLGDPIGILGDISARYGGLVWRGDLDTMVSDHPNTAHTNESRGIAGAASREQRHVRI